MERNKVIFNGEVLIDLSEDTAIPSKVLSGETFHNSSGEKVTGECTFDADTKDATASKDDILTGKTAYRNGSKVTGSMPNNGAVTLTISDKNASIKVPYGFHDGSGTAVIDKNEKNKLISSNIRAGVTILGVTGDLTEDSENPEPTRTVTPTVSDQTIVPAAGYTCLREIVVKGIPYKEVQNTAGGLTVTIG